MTQHNQKNETTENSLPQWWQDYVAQFEEITPEKIDFGRWLFAQNCDFFAAVQTLDRMPENPLPEIAFAGRSNVGKSSLLNSLTGQKALARTSNTPGRTQQMNFFNLGEKLALVDLPGYGYAKVAKTLSKSWLMVMKAYLQGRPNLQRCCILIDARHGIKENDLEMMALLDKAAVTYFLVLTKCDKISKSALQKLLSETQKTATQHAACFPFALPTSSQKKNDPLLQEGMGLLRALLASFAMRPE